MKYLYLFLLIFSISPTAFSQKVTIKEIKRKPNPKFYSRRDITIIYPVIVTKNPGAGKFINDEIRNEILGSDEDKVSLQKRLNNLIDKGLIDLSYEITFNKNDILSLKIYSQESGGNHLTSSETYFNFDIKAGKNISMADLIYGSKIDAFEKKVFEDKIIFLKKYREEEKINLDNNQIDSATYNQAIEEVDSNCINAAQIEDFSLWDRNIEIIDPCQFPGIIRSREPTYELKYSYKFALPFLKPAFQQRLLK